MTVRLRLQRRGTRKRPFYRLVAADKRAPRDGRFIEQLGVYDPLREPNVLDIDKERVDYWISVGAQPSDTVRGLLVRLEKGETITMDQSEELRKQELEAAREAALTGAPPRKPEVPEDTSDEEKAEAKSEGDGKEEAAEAKDDAGDDAAEAKDDAGDDAAEAKDDADDDAAEAKDDAGDDAAEAKDDAGDDDAEAEKAEASDDGAEEAAADDSGDEESADDDSDEKEG